MFRNGVTLVTFGAVLCVELLGASLRATALDKQTDAINDPSRVRVEDVNPFTHSTYIPASTDPSTIRFEKAHQVKVTTRIRYTWDKEYCSELAFREPGGSRVCPSVRTEARATAFEVTYSYLGQPLAAEEDGNRYFTFQVYFRPDELPPNVREAFAARKLSRKEAAGYFAVTTSRELVHHVAIDETGSRFCGATLRDGTWTQTDPNCQERIKFKSITTPSEYLAVKVDPVPSS